MFGPGHRFAEQSDRSVHPQSSVQNWVIRFRRMEFARVARLARMFARKAVLGDPISKNGDGECSVCDGSARVVVIITGRP